MRHGLVGQNSPTASVCSLPDPSKVSASLPGERVHFCRGWGRPRVFLWERRTTVRQDCARQWLFYQLLRGFLFKMWRGLETECFQVWRSRYGNWKYWKYYLIFYPDNISSPQVCAPPWQGLEAWWLPTLTWSLPAPETASRPQRRPAGWPALRTTPATLSATDINTRWEQEIF